MTHEEFEIKIVDYLNIQKDQIRLMLEYYYTYKRMHELLDQYETEMNISSSFFILTFRAYRTAMVLWFTKVFAKREKQSLYKFLNFIEQNRRYLTIEYMGKRPGQDPTSRMFKKTAYDIKIEKINEDRTLLESTKETVDKLLYLRDKYHAHTDIEFVIKKDAALEDTELTFKEMDNLAKIGLEFISYYEAGYNRIVTKHLPMNWDDLEKMLKILKDKSC